MSIEDKFPPYDTLTIDNKFQNFKIIGFRKLDDPSEIYVAIYDPEDEKTTRELEKLYQKSGKKYGFYNPPHHDPTHGFDEIPLHKYDSLTLHFGIPKQFKFGKKAIEINNSIFDFKKKRKQTKDKQQLNKYKK